MAPESSSAIYDAKVDIYSAAVTFYELFEQANFDPDMPFAFAITPSKGTVPGLAFPRPRTYASHSPSSHVPYGAPSCDPFRSGDPPQIDGREGTDWAPISARLDRLVRRHQPGANAGRWIRLLYAQLMASVMHSRVAESEHPPQGSTTVTSWTHR